MSSIAICTRWSGSTKRARIIPSVPTMKVAAIGSIQLSVPRDTDGSHQSALDCNIPTSPARIDEIQDIRSQRRAAINASWRSPTQSWNLSEGIGLPIRFDRL
jgi:hypothetical protein